MQLPCSLKRVSKKYGFPENDAAQLAFAHSLDAVISMAKRRFPDVFSSLKNKDTLVVVDVGCGYMRYSSALSVVLAKINPDIKLYCVDKEKLVRDYKGAKFFKCDIADFVSVSNIKDVDIFTVFNPFPGIPSLPLKATCLIGCVDWNRALFEKSLLKNRYKNSVWHNNSFQNLMRPWFNNYDPFVFATP